VWDHREPRRHWLVAPIAFPWRDERAKPVEGRVAAAAHFGCWLLCVVCCVLCVVCCVLCVVCYVLCVVCCGCDEPFLLPYW
jgi:hypothetical protein